MINGYCDPACSLGQELEVPVYKFVKEALIRRFGEDWYLELDKVAQDLKNNFKVKYFIFVLFIFPIFYGTSRYFTCYKWLILNFVFVAVYIAIFCPC
jgi:hypothetical protein